MSDIRLRLALIFIVSQSFLAGTAFARADDCRLVQLASLDLVTTPDGQVLVPVTIAGSPRKLELQLEAAYSAISNTTATELSLKRRPMPERVTPVIKGQNIVELAYVPSFQLGRLGADDTKLFVIPVWNPSSDGILGLDYLHGQDVELDLSHGKLNLFSRDHCRGKVIYWNPPGAVAAMPLSLQKTGNILIDMALDGKHVVAGITTASQTRMGMNAARRLFGLNEHSPQLELQKNVDSSNSEPAYRYPFRTLELEGLKVENPAVVILGEKQEPECNGREQWSRNEKEERQSVICYGGADLFLGLSVLRRLHLYFAFEERMLYATLSDPPSPSPAPH